MFSDIQMLEKDEARVEPTEMTLRGAPHVLLGMIARAFTLWVDELVQWNYDMTGDACDADWRRQQYAGLVKELARRLGLEDM